MNSLRAAIALLAAAVCFARAQTPSTNRDPQAPISLTWQDRNLLVTRTDSLGWELKKLRAALSNNTKLEAFLPDIEVFHKAANWAVVFNEFYRTNEIAAAKKLVDQALARARDLAGGEAPWAAATGLVVRAYRSRIDQSIQPYGLVVPDSFAPGDGRTYRLDVWLHGRDNHLTELKFINDRQRSRGEFAPPDTFVLHPYGRYCNAFKFAGEIDVMEVIEHVRRNYPIDPSRIGIRGFSMGGAGTWHLAAHYPSIWAAAAPGAGFAETAIYTRALEKNPPPPWYEQTLWRLYDATDYAANFFNLPVIAYSGELDKQRQAAEVMAQAMESHGLTLTHLIGPNTGHKYEPATKAELAQRFDQLVTQSPPPFPIRIRFETSTLRYNSNHWIIVNGLERHWERASVHAEISGGNGSISVQTTNVSGLSLNVAKPPWHLWSSVTAFNRVVLDDYEWNISQHRESRKLKGFPIPNEIHFEKSDGRWTRVPLPDATPLRKRHKLQGPIDDAFMDSFIMVRPTQRPLNAKAAQWIEEEFAHATNEWRAQFRGDAIVKTDLQITDQDLLHNHLILWGDPESNEVLGRIARYLPVQWRDREIRMAGRSFPSARCVPVLIFPNPLNPSRYVVINSGFTFCEFRRASNAQQVPKLPDYAILDTRVSRAARYPDGVALAGFFDEQWKISRASPGAETPHDSSTH